MIRHGDVVLTVLLSCEAHMTTCLPRHLIAEFSQGSGKIIARKVSRQPQTAMTSSWTK